MDARRVRFVCNFKLNVNKDGGEKLVQQAIDGQRAIPGHGELRALLSNRLLCCIQNGEASAYMCT